jgi:hypothetical protein
MSEAKRHTIKKKVYAKELSRMMAQQLVRDIESGGRIWSIYVQTWVLSEVINEKEDPAEVISGKSDVHHCHPISLVEKIKCIDSTRSCTHFLTGWGSRDSSKNLCL